MIDPTVDSTEPTLLPSVATALAALGDLPAPTPASVDRVMERVRARPVPVPQRTVAQRLRQPASWGRLRSTGPGAIAAAVLLVVGAAGLAASRALRVTPYAPRGTVVDSHPASESRGISPVPPADGPAAGALRSAHFVVRAPSARRVAVVGDFNAWDPTVTPLVRDTISAAWTASVSLRDGRYVYAYVVDGRRWMADPNAPLAPPDGFGQQNSVLVVGPQYALATPSHTPPLQ